MRAANSGGAAPASISRRAQWEAHARRARIKKRRTLVRVLSPSVVFWIPRSTRRTLRRRTLSHPPSLPSRRVRSFGKTNKMADAEWDTSKENFQPLRKGRDAKMLSEASGMRHGERATKLKEERRCVSRRASRISNRRCKLRQPAETTIWFWRRPLTSNSSNSHLSPRSAFWEAISNYDGDDPLEVWVRFIKWTEQTCTAGGRETELLPLLERCTRELQEVPRYKDDARYLRVWVKYADCCREPHDIFKFLQANDIGQRHTLFYEAYAAFLEIRGAFKHATEVYDRGVMMRAQPRERLKDKLAQFQHRMMRRRQRKLEESGNSTILEEEEEESGGDRGSRRFGERGGRAPDAENPGGSVRAGGGGVGGTSGAASRRGRGLRGAAAAAAAAATTSSSGNAGGGGLEIYCDDDDEPALAVTAPAPWRNLPKYQEIRKENSQGASSWAGQKMKQKRSRPGQAGAPLPAATLEVYHDEDLAAEQDAAAEAAAAGAKAAAESARRNANALRRRLDAGDAAGALRAGLTVDPARRPPTGGAATGCRATLYGVFDPRDATDDAGEEVSYEERRARRWEAANGPAKGAPLAPGPLVGANSREAAMEVDMEVDMEESPPRGAMFATSTATTAPAGAGAAAAAVAEAAAAAAAARSPEMQSKPPRADAPEPKSADSCDAPLPDAGSGVGGVRRDDTDRAQGAGLAPAAAPPPAADAVVPAGLRWTATEGGTYGADPTMTLCTKEAWGDIMSLFSGGLASDNEEAARRARKAVETGNGAANMAATKAPALGAVAEEAPAAETAPEGGGDEFAIYEDTCLLPAAAAAARAAPAPAPGPAADAFEGLEIREDTVVIPPVGRTPAPARAGLSARTPLAAMPARTPLAPANPAPAPPVTAGSAARAPLVPPDDGGFDVYEDTVHLDPAAMAAAGVGSQSSAPAGVAPTPRTFGEPSENGPDDRARDDEDEETRDDDAENAAPRGFPAVDTFRPRSIADAAAAMAALRPLPVPLDLRSESDDAGERARAEEIMRAAAPPPELRGEDDFAVYEDDDETAPVPKVF